MCIGVPMKILRVNEKNAEVDIAGVRRTVRLDLLDRTPEMGEYVIVHAGFAIQLIDESEAMISLAYLKEFLSDGTETPG